MNNLTPEAFKQRVLSANPSLANGVASDGTSYSAMDPLDFTERVVKAHPGGTTSDGHKYSDFLPPAPQAPAPSTTPDTSLLGKLKGRASDLGTELSDASSGKQQNLAMGGLNIAGTVGGAVNDVVGSGIGLANSGFRKIPGVAGAEDYVTGGIASALASPAGQAAQQGVQSFEQNYPVASKVVGDLGNVVGAGLATTGIEAGAEGIGNALGKSELDSVASDIAPNLTGKTLAKSLAKGGTSKTGILRTITSNISPAVSDAAQTVIDNVPGFSRLSTFSDKVNAVNNAVSDMAQSLKQDVIDSGSDRIYPIKQLASTLRNLPVPDSIVGDMEKVYGKVINKAISFAEEQGGKVSNLLDARKDFDSYIQQTFPNLYTNVAESPMRIAVKNVRNGISQFTADNLPDTLDFRQRLLDQSDLMKAAENMAPKAAKELGTNAFQRLGINHPIISGAIKNIARLGGIGAGISGSTALGEGLYQKVFGQR